MTHFTRFAVCLLPLMLLVPLVAQTDPGPAATTAKVTAEDEDGDLTLKRPEQVALMFIAAISSLESDCKDNLDRLCTLDELVAGPKDKDGRPFGKLTFDPNKTDESYEYKVASADGKWQVWATPKKAGLRGFYFTGSGFMSFPDKYYDGSGAASAKSRKLTGYAITGDSFRTR